MRKRDRDRLYRRLSYGRDDFEQLADQLFAYKTAIYRETLVDLAELHGYDEGATADELQLGPKVSDALAADAERAARQIIATYNRELGDLLEKYGRADRASILDAVEEWSTRRAETKAPLIATSEAYNVHADATAAFYRDAGVAPTFEFGGHGDAPPKCELCKALVEGSPWPLSKVVEIGTPHLGCRQSWHANIDDAELPDTIDLGQGDTAGIVGAPTLDERHGSKEQAARAVTS